MRSDEIRSDDLPTGKWKRTLTGGKTVAQVGGRVLAYYAKRPFLSGDDQHKAREAVSRESAQALFKGLSLLKGTALKMAQQLSLEMDLLPEAACRELAKAYHQVPPINRALVRKVVQDGLGGTLESHFESFDLRAHAAASLGQVHRAVGLDGRSLAVKIQYPGIAKTIDSDVALLRQMLRPMVQGDHLRPTLDEVAARLREEVDYEQEAQNCTYFAKVLNVDGVRIPAVVTERTAPTVLTTTFMPGRPLDRPLQQTLAGFEERQGLAIDPHTADCRWMGEPMDYDHVGWLLGCAAEKTDRHSAGCLSTCPMASPLPWLAPVGQARAR